MIVVERLRLLNKLMKRNEIQGWRVGDAEQLLAADEAALLPAFALCWNRAGRQRGRQAHFARLYSYGGCTMSKKLLLAEDEPVLRMLVVDTLEDEGYAIDEACDGEEAYHFIMSRHYDLVILDYMMPKMTGIEIIEKVRQFTEKERVKILMLSAKSQQAEQDKVMAAGADGFMSKPFSPLELVDKVEEMLRG